MEFWGVEVKPGQPLKVDPEMGKLIHISQAALGEMKDAKSAKNIPLRLKIDDKKFVIGSLATENRTQIMFDLVFEKEFELSHDWKHGSVYFMGYMADDPVSDGEDFFSDDDDDSGDEMLEAQQNGEVKEKPVAVKDNKGAADKAVAKKEETSNLAKVQEDDDESDSDSDEEMGEEDDSSDDQDLEDGDEDDSSEEEEEEEDLPKKSKKRVAEPAEGTPPVPAKKSKSSTPDKTGNKKGHVATPFPSKPGKTPAGGNKKKGNNPSPKSSHGKAKQGKK